MDPGLGRGQEALIGSLITRETQALAAGTPITGDLSDSVVQIYALMQVGTLRQPQ